MMSPWPAGRGTETERRSGPSWVWEPGPVWAGSSAKTFSATEAEISLSSRVRVTAVSLTLMK